MKKKKYIQIETIFMWLAILLLIVLGIRGRLEVRIQSNEKTIFELEQEVQDNLNKINYLKEQLEAPKYSQPLNQIIVSSITGIRVNPMGGGTERLHKGVDLIGKEGDPVKALLSGEIAEHWLPPGWYGKEYFRGHPIFGGYIVIDHGEELFSLYGHFSKTFVQEGDWIEAGQIIGEMGNTGISTGCHLHLEITINPFRYLNERRK